MKTKTIFIKTKSYIELHPIFIKSKNLYLLETKIHKKVLYESKSLHFATFQFVKHFSIFSRKKYKIKSLKTKNR